MLNLSLEIMLLGYLFDLRLELLSWELRYVLKPSEGFVYLFCGPLKISLTNEKKAYAWLNGQFTQASVEEVIYGELDNRWESQSEDGRILN